MTERKRLRNAYDIRVLGQAMRAMAWHALAWSHFVLGVFASGSLANSEGSDTLLLRN